MSDWRIHRREERCARCQRPFLEGEAMFSLLDFEGDRLRREDLCPGCFTEPAAARAELLFWRTRHTLDGRRRFAVDFEAIEELFLKLEPRAGESLDGNRAELRYLLALLLLRKKRLKLVGVRHAGGETFCVRRPRRQEEFEVPVFELDSERAQALKAELARVFEGSGAEALERPTDPSAAGGRGTRVGERVLDPKG